MPNIINSVFFRKYKSTYALLLFFIFLSACTNQDDEAKKFGFSDAAEMKWMNSKGFQNKQEYADSEAKNFGFENEREMIESKKLHGVDPLVYILEKKWSPAGLQCDPLGESYVVYTNSEPLGELIVQQGKPMRPKMLAEHEFKVISDREILLISRMYLKGVDMYENLFNNPESILVVEAKKEIKLITRNKIRIKNTEKVLDMLKLSSRTIEYENRTPSEKISELCDGNKNEATAAPKVDKSISSKNFLVGTCTWDKNINLQSCDPKQVALLLKKLETNMNYIAWGDKELTLRVIGYGAFSENKIPVTYKVESSSSVEVTIHGRNNCNIVEKYNLENDYLKKKTISYNGGCDDVQKPVLDENIGKEKVIGWQGIQ